MAGISPKLPLHRSNDDGYWGLTQTVSEALRQNLKNLILTIPGERVMMPEFGVGLARYLFENESSFVTDEIKAKIIEQVGIYMPGIILVDIEIIDSPEYRAAVGRNAISVKIYYRVEPLNIDDILDIVIE